MKTKQTTRTTKNATIALFFKAVAILFIVVSVQVVGVSVANSAYTELDWSFLSNSVGSSTISVNNTPLNDQLAEASNNLFEFKGYTKTNKFDLVVNSVNGCNPGIGGLTGSPDTVINLNSTYQNNDNPGVFSDCSVTGNYYWVYSTRRSIELPSGDNYNNCNEKDCFYVSWYYNAENNTFSRSQLDQTFFINQTNTTEFINILSPEYGSTTASTTVNISVRFSTPLTLDFRPATIRTIEILDAVTNEIQHISTSTLNSNSSENLTVNQTFEMATGTKIVNAFYSYENGTPYSEVDTIYFNVIDNSYFNATGLVDPLQSPGLLSQNNCEIYEIGCQFQRALIFLLYPSDGILDRFANLWQSLQYKIPFGYVTVTIEQLKNLDDNSSPAFDFGEIPFSNEIFTPFRDLIGGILWAIFAIAFYQRRLTKLEL